MNDAFLISSQLCNGGIYVLSVNAKNEQVNENKKYPI